MSKKAPVTEMVYLAPDAELGCALVSAKRSLAYQTLTCCDPRMMNQTAVMDWSVVVDGLLKECPVQTLPERWA